MGDAVHAVQENRCRLLTPSVPRACRSWCRTRCTARRVTCHRRRAAVEARARCGRRRRRHRWWASPTWRRSFASPTACRWSSCRRPGGSRSCTPAGAAPWRTSLRGRACARRARRAGSAGGEGAAAPHGLRTRCCGRPVVPRRMAAPAAPVRSALPARRACLRVHPPRLPHGRGRAAARRGVRVQRVRRPLHPCGMLRVRSRRVRPVRAAFGDDAVPRRGAWTCPRAVALRRRGAGVDARRVCDAGACTACDAGRWYSYRASGGVCGRHGALAFARTEVRTHGN